VRHADCPIAVRLRAHIQRRRLARLRALAKVLSSPVVAALVAFLLSSTCAQRAFAQFSGAPAVGIPVSPAALASAGPGTITVGPPAAVAGLTPLPGGVGGHLAIGSGLSLAAGLNLFMNGPDATLVPQATLSVERVHPGARWRGGILFDEPMRDAFLIGSHDGRETAARISDMILAATVVNSFMLDAFAIPLANDDPQLALDASVAYSLALGMTLVLGELVKEGVSRARPYERYCEENPNAAGCGNEDSYASFYSLHSGVAFTNAGFSCSMHLERNLYGDAGADGASCATSLVMASTVAILRVSADRHYLTDVLVGAAIGMVVGYLVPVFMVPEHRTPGETATPGMLVMPLFSPGADGSLSTSTVGLSLAGGW